MVSVTARAQEKLQGVLEAQGAPDTAVRIIAVRGPHGCVHGWNLVIDETQRPDDTVVQAGLLRVLADSEIAAMLDGASIDYREDSMGIGFIIDAPDALAHGHHQEGGCHHQ